METRANYVAVGTFVLALALGLAVFVIWLGRISFEQVSDRYLIYFRGAVTGLQEGSPVRYRGIPVGQVVDARIDPDNVEQVRVLIEVEHGTPIVAGSVAALEFQGITGAAFVQIHGGTQGAAVLTAERGQPYPVIPSQPSSLAAVIESAPQLLERASRALESLNGFMTPANQRAVAQILDNASTLTQALAAESDRIAGTVERVDLLVGNVDGLVTDLRGTTARIGETLGTVDEAATQVSGLSRSFTRTANQVNGLLGDVRGPIRDFAGSGLYELSLTISELRTLAQNLSRVAERLDRSGGAGLLLGPTSQGRRVE